MILGNKVYLLPANHLTTSEEESSHHKGDRLSLLFFPLHLHFLWKGHSDLQGGSGQAMWRLSSVSWAEMERELPQGWLVAGPFLCLKHTNIITSCCQNIAHRDRVRSGCTGKQPLNAVITGLERLCCPELWKALGAQVKRNGKLQLHYFKADCIGVSPLLEGIALVLLS